MDVTIQVSELVEGMYVSDLDRPWTDTPFLLQGFVFCRDQHHIPLRDYCRYVYVNLERSIDPGAHVLHRRFGPKQPKPLSRWERFKRWLGRCFGATPRRRGEFSQPGAVVTSTRSGQAAQPVLTSAVSAERETYCTEGPWTLLPGWPAWIARLFACRGRSVRPMTEREALDAAAVIVVEDEKPVQSSSLVHAREVYRCAHESFRTVLNDIRRDRRLQLSTLNEIVDRLVGVASEHPHALVWLSRLKGHAQSAYEHAIDVSIFMVCLGRHLGYPPEQLQFLGLAGLLQDVGYIEIPDQLLLHASTLTPEEFSQIKRHVEHGLKLLAGSEGMPPRVLDIVAQHHERYDGSGYPRGLQKEDIDPLAQIAGIADTFNSMTSHRPHRNAAATNAALQNLYKWKGTCFNDGLVEQFIQCIGIFSVGTLVELSSGEVGVVIAQNRIRRLKPRVMVILDAQRRAYPSPYVLELINDPLDASGAPYCIRRDLPPGSYDINPQEFFL